MKLSFGAFWIRGCRKKWNDPFQEEDIRTDDCLKQHIGSLKWPWINVCSVLALIFKIIENIDIIV